MPTEPTDASEEAALAPSDGPAAVSEAPPVGLLLTVLDSLVVGVIVLDGDGRVVFANRTVYDTVSAPAGSLTGQRLDAAVMAGFEFEEQEVESTTAESIDDIHPWWRDDGSVGPRFHEVTRLRFRHEAPGGRARRGWITTRRTVDDRGQPIVVVSISDITAQEDERERLRHRASTDVLTGLDNRAVLEEALDRYVAAANADGRPSGSLLFIDLDSFKQVNDELGHGAGDRVLEIVGQRLRDASVSDVAGQVTRLSAPAGDAVAARYGGDEFVVLTDATEIGEIERLVMRVRDRIAGAVELGGSTVQVRASIGWARIDPGSSIRSVLDVADRRVYEAKLQKPST